MRACGNAKPKTTALERLQKTGLIAPEGEVDRVMQTVVNNLIFTNNLNIQPEVRTRVLLTTPLESFTVGHTIVLSRGLLDVLPDEATLAMILAHELAHIVLGHRLDTKFAFNDRMFFADENTFARFDFARDPGEEQAADRKAMELLANSPYKGKLERCGLVSARLATGGPGTQEFDPAASGQPAGKRERCPHGRSGQLCSSAEQPKDGSDRCLAPGRADQTRSLELPSRFGERKTGGADHVPGKNAV